MAEAQKNIVAVPTAGYGVGHAPQVLTTSGIGSCIVLCLYDESKQIGALAHMLLPKQLQADQAPLRYVDSAIPLVLQTLDELHVSRLTLQVMLFGGANMFPNLWTGDSSIGQKNIDTAHQILQRLNLPIRREEVGGHHGRNLRFDLQSGRAILSTQYSNLQMF